MKINGAIRKNILIAMSGGIILTLVIAGAIFFVPLIIPTTNPNQNPNSNPSIGKVGRLLAKYFETRGPDVEFSWAFNNSIINLNVTESSGTYVDGVVTYGSIDNESITNITLVHPNGLEFALTDSGQLKTVADKFIQAMENLDNQSETINSWDDFWPPTFLWDIAFKDGTSLSLVYSQEKHVFAAVNGTYTMQETEIVPGSVIQFAQFHYDWDNYNDRKYFDLDAENEALIVNGIASYLSMINSAFSFS
ncbi:MAG: hypothetical protein ACFFD1_12650 [Candidatus Thorarchaeota archaeon]